MRPNHSKPREIARLAQQLPTCDERLKNEIAQVGMVVDELLESLRAHLVHLTRATGVTAQQSRPAAELRQIAGEISWFVDGDRPRGVAGLIHDFDRATNENVEPRVALAGVEEARRRLGSACAW